jgi:rsbT antagonist protein RsbS
LSDLSVHVSKGCLVIPVQGNIDDKRIQAIQKEILMNVEKQDVKGVVIDLSGVNILEPYYAGVIDKTAKMINLLGAKTIISGINPGVAISLLDSHFEFEEIFGTARTFEDGVERLQPVIRVGEENKEIKSEEKESEEEKESVELKQNSEAEQEYDQEESDGEEVLESD